MLKYDGGNELTEVQRAGLMRRVGQQQDSSYHHTWMRFFMNRRPASEPSAGWLSGECSWSTTRMGCAQSCCGGPVNESDIHLEGSVSEAAGSRGRTSGSREAPGFDSWNTMEQAEEQEYLAEEEEDEKMGALLAKRYPDRGISRKMVDLGEASGSYEDWEEQAASFEPDGSFDLLSAPFTLKKADAFFRYLRRPDAKPVPQRCVYDVLIASCRQMDERQAESGSLQRVPPPNSGKKLYVCGDTHGQLQDVLLIFDLHGTPAPGNAYLFNGDIADRGKYAVEIFMLLLVYKLAPPP